jgi:hypothetical protein
VLLEADRAKVAISQAARMAATCEPFPTTYFDPENTPCSIDEQSFQVLQSPQFHGKAPAPGNLMALAWMAMLKCSDDPNKLHRMWLSTLCTVGSVIWNRKSGVSTFVAHVSVYGVLGLALKAEKVGDEQTIPLEFSGSVQRQWVFVVLDDHADWFVRDVEFMTPGAATHFVQTVVGGAGIALPFLRVCPGADPLVLHACNNGFRNILATNLLKLHTRLMIPVPEGSSRPTNEKSCMMALIRYLRPDISDDDLKVLLAKRFSKPEEVSMLLADEEHKKLIEDVVDEVEAFKVNEEIDKVVSGIEQASKHAASCLPGSGKAASSQPAQPSSTAASSSAGPPTGPGRAAPAQKQPGEHTYMPRIDRDALRFLLPSLPGCSMTPETEWHLRWRVTYPGVKATSLVFHDEESEIAAVACLLDWAWEEHTKATGAVSPFVERWQDLL